MVSMFVFFFYFLVNVSYGQNPLKCRELVKRLFDCSITTLFFHFIIIFFKDVWSFITL